MLVVGGGRQRSQGAGRRSREDRNVAGQQQLVCGLRHSLCRG